MIKRDPFYIVWAPDGPSNPRKCHSTFEIAAAEAVRLARIHPGQDFFVMQARQRAKTIEPIEIEDFEIDPDVPF